MNNKGFMMAEVVVVSAVILVALSLFYVNYNKLITLYNERLSYYDPATLYKLADYRNRNCIKGTTCTVPSLGDINKLYFAWDGTERTYYTGKGESIFLLKGTSLSNFNSTALLSSLNKTLDSYVDYLENKLTNEEKNNYILVMEKCDNNKENCKYAYLEVLVKE